MEELNNEEMLGTEGGACGGACYTNASYPRVTITGHRALVNLGPKNCSCKNIKIVEMVLDGKNFTYNWPINGSGVHYVGTDEVNYNQDRDKLQLRVKGSMISKIKIKYEICFGGITITKDGWVDFNAKGTYTA